MKSKWTFKSLGDVCHVIGGGTPSKERLDFYGGDIPWATIRDMRQDWITETEHRITQDALKNSASNVIPAGNVVIATRVGLGKVSMVAQGTAINQDLRGIVPIDRRSMDPRFLFWWAKNVSPLIVKAGTGATVQGVKVPFVKSLKIPVLPNSEQRRIVSILDEAFDGIAAAKASAEKNLHNARALFESFMELVFERRGQGWLERQLAELCDIKHGFAFKSEFFSESGEYVLLTPGNFFESGGYRDRGEKQKYFKGEIPDGYILSEGDLLVAMTEQAAGLLGSPVLVPESDKFLHNQRLGLVVKKPGVPWTNEFFFHVFNARNVRKSIHDSASGVKVRHTSPSKIGEVIVSFPSSISEQRAIVRKFADVKEKTDRLVSIYQRKLAALDELKQSLLHQAFSGAL